MTSILSRKLMTGFSRQQYSSKIFSMSYFHFLQKHFVSESTVKVLESSHIQQCAKIHQRTFSSVSIEVSQLCFDIFISMYRMDIIFSPMNTSMFGHHFECTEQCVVTISHRSAVIWSKSFDSKPFEMRKSKFWRIAEFLLSCSFD